LGNHDNPRVGSRFPGRLDQMTMLSMTLPGMAVTYNGDEIGMVDDRNISFAQTQDPEACIAGKDHYTAISRDPERTPFQWSAKKNAGRRRIFTIYNVQLINNVFLNLNQLIIRFGRF